MLAVVREGATTQGSEFEVQIPPATVTEEGAIDAPPPPPPPFTPGGDALSASVTLGLLALVAIELAGAALALSVAPIDASDSNRWADVALARELRTLLSAGAAAMAALAAAAAIEPFASGRQGPLASRPVGLVKALLKMSLGLLAAAVGVALSLVLRRALFIIALALGVTVTLVTVVVAPAAAAAAKPADTIPVIAHGGGGDGRAPVAATAESAPGASHGASPPTPSRLQWLRSPLARSGSRRSGSMSYPAWADGGALGLA